MNHKIKGIEIDAFRVYKDKQMFNFLNNSGEIANLVVIYAPNGYGKTSFIDAVEWILAGHINRISKNTVVKSTADNEQGMILKNRKSEKKFGRVKLITESDEILEKKTKEIGKHNRKTDYADGDLISKSNFFDDINLSDYTNKYILGQDKIDSFLRSVNPRDRYDILTHFWDDTNDSVLFKNILGMYKESEKQLLESTKNLKEINKEINDLYIRPNIALDVNNLVNRFNKLNIDDLIISDLDVNNDNNNKVFINLLIETKSKLQLILTSTQRNEVLSTYLIENYLSNKKNDEIMNNLSNEIKEISSYLEKFKKREDKKQLLSDTTIKIFDINLRYKKFLKLKSGHTNYANILGDINRLEETNRELIKNISSLTSRQAKEEILLHELKVKKENVQSDKSDLQKKFNELDSNLNKYRSLKKKEEHKREIKIKELINIRSNRIQKLESKKIQLESFMNYATENFINIQIDDDNIMNKLKELKEKSENTIEKEKDLKVLEKEYLEFGKLSDQLNKIIKFGKKFIEDSSLVTCPLCKKEYKDFNELISNVNKNFVDVDNINKLTLRIGELESEISNEQDDVENTVLILKKQMSEEIESLSIEILKNEKINNLNNVLSERINKKLKIVKSDLNELYDFFASLDIDINNTNPVYLTSVKSSIISRIDNFSKSIDKYLIEENLKMEDQIKISEEIDSKELLIVSNKNNIRELKSDSILNDINQLLDELKIDYNIEEVNLEIANIKEEFIIHASIKESIEKDIQVLNDDLEAKEWTDLIDIHRHKQKRLIDIGKDVQDYRVKVNTLLPKVETFGIEEIEEVHKYFTNRKNVLNQGVEILNELTEFTTYIEKNIESKSKEPKKRLLELSIEKLEKGKKELFNAKNEVTRYIENKISNAFNLDFINSIYQRIDPHPDFNNIKFETDLAKDKPELQIYATTKEKDKLAPILYFSSAQVNILSLSIFLARALLEDDQGFNTIFMDDPIQHLDNLNILSFIDLLRTITVHLNKQVILSTHNENFYKLIRRKMDPRYTSAKFIELESFGRIKN